MKLIPAILKNETVMINVDNISTILPALPKYAFCRMNNGDVVTIDANEFAKLQRNRWMLLD